MKKFTWIVKFTVDETWIEDGFEINKERAKSMIENALPFSHSNETKATVLKSPLKKDIRKIQGY